MSEVIVKRKVEDMTNVELDAVFVKVEESLSNIPELAETIKLNKLKREYLSNSANHDFVAKISENIAKFHNEILKDTKYYSLLVNTVENYISIVPKKSNELIFFVKKFTPKMTDFVYDSVYLTEDFNENIWDLKQAISGLIIKNKLKIESLNFVELGNLL